MKKIQHQPGDSLGYYADQVFRYLTLRLGRKFIGHGEDVTVEQWKVLVRLKSKDGQTQNQLSIILDKSESSTTRLIHGLEKRNLVVRTPDQIDARIKRIYLTHKGKEVETKLTILAKKNLEEAWHGISLADKNLTKSTLKKVLQNIKTEI